MCGGGVANDVWVAQPAVRDALHVPRDANFFSGDNGDGMTYDLSQCRTYRRQHSPDKAANETRATHGDKGGGCRWQADSVRRGEGSSASHCSTWPLSTPAAKFPGDFTLPESFLTPLEARRRIPMWTSPSLTHP